MNGTIWQSYSEHLHQACRLCHHMQAGRGGPPTCPREISKTVSDAFAGDGHVQKAKVRDPLRKLSVSQAARQSCGGQQRAGA